MIEIFDTDEDRSYFLVELPINSYFTDNNKNQDKVQDEVQDKVQDKVQDEAYLQELKTLGPNETELKILKMLKMLKTAIISKKQIAFNLEYKATSKAMTSSHRLNHYVLQSTMLSSAIKSTSTFFSLSLLT